MTTKPKDDEQAAAAAEAEAEAEQVPPTVPPGTIDSEGTFRPS